MKTTGIFTIHEFTIPFDEYGQPIYVIPFGDIHRSSPACAEEHWLDYCRWAATKPRCYFLGMGDYDDMASTSERMLLGNRTLHDGTRETLEDMYRRLTDRFAKEVAFMRGRTIGLIEGNHYGEFQNATTTTQRLAEALDCKYLGVNSYIRLRFAHTTRKTPMTIDIWAHHGLGGGRSSGASINKVDDMVKIADADIYLMGHDHHKSIDFDEKLTLQQGGGTLRLKAKKILKARTGSFLRGYVEGKPSYIAEAGMKAADIGVVKIELTPKRDRRGGVDDAHIDIHASA